MTAKIIKIIGSFIWVVILSFLALIVITFLPIKGNYKVYTVQSGSMEPTIHTGSLIFVKSMSNYNVGDIVTRATNDSKVTITHRIVSINNDNGKISYKTKGDANEDVDGEMTSQSNVVGKEIFIIPYIGYPIGYARTMPGFILLVIIPAVVIIYEEIKNIKDEIVKSYKRRKRKSEILEEFHPLKKEPIRFTGKSRIQEFDEFYPLKEEYFRYTGESRAQEATFKNTEIVPEKIIKARRRMGL